MSSFDVILHPTDFSSDSLQAFDLACNMVRDQFSTLVVVHVLPPNFDHDGDPDTEPDDEDHPGADECRRQFAHMKSMAPDIPISFRMVVGHAVGAVLKVAAEVDAGLIVIASHRHDQFHLQLHGSVTEGLLRQSHCPVLVLRQPPTSLRRLPTRTIEA